MKRKLYKIAAIAGMIMILGSGMGCSGTSPVTADLGGSDDRYLGGTSGEYSDSIFQVVNQQQDLAGGAKSEKVIPRQDLASGKDVPESLAETSEIYKERDLASATVLGEFNKSKPAPSINELKALPYS